MRYFGFYAKDNYADNTELYRRNLENPQQSMNHEAAKKNLEFSKRFPPGNPHSRLVGHAVDVYSIENPIWEIRKENAYPKGKMKNIFSADLGKSIMLECGGETTNEEILDMNYVHMLSDGTEVRGVRVRVTKNKGPPIERIVDNDYFDIAYDSSHFKDFGEFNYHFDIKRDRIDLSNVLIYYILKYVDVDNERISKEMEVVTPVFDLFEETNRPDKFANFSYRHPKTDIRLL